MGHDTPEAPQVDFVNPDHRPRGLRPPHLCQMPRCHHMGTHRLRVLGWAPGADQARETPRVFEMEYPLCDVHALNMVLGDVVGENCKSMIQEIAPAVDLGTLVLEAYDLTGE